MTMMSKTNIYELVSNLIKISYSMSNCDDQAVADQALDLFSEQADVSEENSKYALVGMCNWR